MKTHAFSSASSERFKETQPHRGLFRQPSGLVRMVEQRELLISLGTAWISVKDFSTYYSSIEELSYNMYIYIYSLQLTLKMI